MTLPIVVIMAGGRGERFWPRSRRNYPKQLLNLVGTDSLLQQSVARLAELTVPERIFIVTNQDYADKVREQLPRLPSRNILIEPVGRNTAPCVGLAAIYTQDYFPGEDPVLAILPSDSLVHYPDEMLRVLRAGIDYSTNTGTGVIYGMWPSRPETGFGYIHLGAELGSSKGVPYHRVAAFKEKPDYPTAMQYLESKEYLWNGGIFVWQCSSLLKEFEIHLPQLFQGLMDLAKGIGTPGESSMLTTVYPFLPAISFDYGILEKSGNLVVIPTDYGWDDLGSWSALERILPRDDQGNVVQGVHCGVETRDCIIHSPKKLVATLGVSDLIIVETDDTLLVCSKDKAQEIRKVVEKLRAEKREELL